MLARIGTAKARRLWDYFGEDLLYKILDGGDVQRLKEVLATETAEQTPLPLVA